MAEFNTFVGTGRNPEGKDLPLGLGMQIAQEPNALETFGKLTTQQRNQLVDYVQGSITGEDAQKRIAEVVNRLRNSSPESF